MTIATRVHGERLRRHMTQEHLATAAGVSAKTIRRLEAGEPVSAETLRAVAAVLELDLLELDLFDAQPASADVFCPKGIEPTSVQRDLIARARTLYGDDLTAIVIPDPVGWNRDRMCRAEASYRAHMNMAMFWAMTFFLAIPLAIVLDSIIGLDTVTQLVALLSLFSPAIMLLTADRAPTFWGYTLPRAAESLHETIVCFANGHVVRLIGGERDIEQVSHPVETLDLFPDTSGRITFTKGDDLAIGPMPSCPPVDIVVRKIRLRQTFARVSLTPAAA